MPKKKKEITITPIGYSSQGVTGSCNTVEFEDIKVMVECGGIQEMRTPLANYNANKVQLSKIRPQELTYIMLAHSHYDHIGNVPALYSFGRCQAPIVVPKGTLPILREMWLDSAKIMDKDCEYLRRKFGKSYEPFYTPEDVEIALSHVLEYESNEMVELTDELSFRFIPSGHIFLGQQIEIYIKLNNHTSKILVTSDLGNTVIEDSKLFVDKFQPVSKANIVIGESTYGLRSKRNTKKDYLKDQEKIKTVIEQFTVDGHGRVLFPVFSLDRTPFMMNLIYNIFKDDESFKVPIVIDSPLAIRLLHCYSSVLDGEIKRQFDEMLNWKNFKYTVDYTESAACMEDKAPKVILSSGGMLQSGRAISWAQSIIPRSNDCIVFSGYCGEGTLGYKIKHSKEQKTVTVNNKILKNRCQMVEMQSMSGHMQHNELVNYYKNIQADNIYLLHGDEQARIELKEDLEEELSKMCKTTKVKIVNKSTVIRL